MRENKRLILIADHDLQVILMLRDYLSVLGHSVLCAHDGEEALALYHANSSHLDLVLLDMNLPKVDGLTILNEVHQTTNVPVVFLTDSQDEYDQIRAFRAGVADYIQKPFSQSILVVRIEAVMQRYGVTEVLPLTVGGISMNLVRRIATADGVRMDLTRREFDLLAFLLSNNGQILTREQLLEEVWGADFDGDLRTVDTHVKQLRSKLGNYVSCLRTIFRVGYQFEISAASTPASR